MKSNKKLLILDLDDTCFSFLAEVLRYINLKNKTRLTTSDMTARIPDASLEDIISEDLWNREFLNWEASSGYSTLKSFDGVRTSIENFIEAGWNVAFVTARPNCFAKQTEFSFIMNKLPGKDSIYYAPKGKRRMLTKLKGDIFLDDSPDNLEAGLASGMPLESLYLISQPWNASETRFQRVGSLMQLERIILEGKKD